MRQIQYIRGTLLALSILLSGLLIISCNHNTQQPEEEKQSEESTPQDPPFGLRSLPATCWQGTCTIFNKDYAIALSFYTEKDGDFYYVDKEADVTDLYKYAMDFTYSVLNDKAIDIHFNSYKFGSIRGKWWVIEISANKLLLVQDIGRPEYYQKRLSLKRIPL